MMTSVGMTAVKVTLVGHGGGAKVGQGLQSGKHLEGA